MTTQDYARPELLVDTDWLEAHLDDPNVRIIDCDQFEEFRRAHIKGAVGMPIHHYIKQPGYAPGPASHEYPLVMPSEPFNELMKDMGIGDDTLVIAYDHGGHLSAARFWWVLNYHGHTNVKVLHGGWRKWFEEGRPSTLDSPEKRDVSFTSKVDDSIVCTVDYGMANVDNSEVLFLDVRADGEWDGSNDRGNKRAGHVPGAVHLEWLNFITEDRARMFKPANELHAMLAAAGVTPEKEVVTY